MPTPYELWLADQKRKTQEAEKNKAEGKINFREASKASRVQYSLPGYEGKSKDKSYKWETDMLKPLSIKKYGRSYNDKFSSLAREQGVDNADEYRRYLDFQEDRKKKGNIAYGTHTQKEILDGIFANMERNTLQSIERNRNKKMYEPPVKQETNKKKTLLDDLKDIGRLAKDTLNPFDNVSVEDAYNNYLHGTSSKAFKEIQRGSNRAVDSASFGLMSNLDKKLSSKTPDYLSQRKFGEGGGTDMVTSGLGYLVPGVGGYKALNSSKAGKALTEFGSKSIPQRLVSEAAKGSIIGAGISGAEVGVREGLNPQDYNWKQNLGYIGMNTAIGGLADPLLYGAGKGIAKGFESASGRAMRNMIPTNESVANELANFSKQYNSFSGRPNVSAMESLIPSGSDLANPNFLPPLKPKSNLEIPVPQTGNRSLLPIAENGLSLPERMQMIGDGGRRLPDMSYGKQLTEPNPPVNVYGAEVPYDKVQHAPADYWRGRYEEFSNYVNQNYDTNKLSEEALNDLWSQFAKYDEPVTLNDLVDLAYPSIKDNTINTADVWDKMGNRQLASKTAQKILFNGMDPNQSAAPTQNILPDVKPKTPDTPPLLDSMAINRDKKSLLSIGDVFGQLKQKPNEAVPAPSPVPKQIKEAAAVSEPVILKSFTPSKDVNAMTKDELKNVHKQLTSQKQALSKAKGKTNKQQIQQIEEDIQQVEGLLMKLDLQMFGENANTLPGEFNAAQHIGEQINRTPSEKPKSPFKDKVKNIMEQTYIKMVDDFYGGTRLDKAAGRNLEKSESATMHAHLAKGAGEKARQELERGFFDEAGKKIGKGFNEIIQGSENPEVLEQYLVARSVLDYDAKGMKAIKTNGLDQKQIAKKAMSDIESQYPSIKAEAEDMYQFIKNQRNILVEGDMLNPVQTKTMDKANENYIPMERVHEDGIESFVGANEHLKNRYANVGNPMKKRTGSERDIISPMQTLVKRQYIYNNMAERNKVGKAVLDNLEVLGKENPFASVVGVEKNGAFKLVDAAGELAGKTEKELPESLNNLFQDADGKNNIVYVYKNGDKYKLQIKDKMLYESMMSLNVKQLPGWMKILNYPTQLLRAGVTLSPDFGLRNLFRDQLTTAVTSKVNYKPFYDALLGASEIIKARNGKSPIVESYTRNGGSMSVLQNIDRANIVKNYQDIVGNKSTRQKLVEIAKDPLKWMEPLRKIGEFSEMSTRIGHYKKALKKGMDPKEATYLARSTMDFNRAGTWGRQINQGVAFFNAAVQGVDVLARSMRDRPVQTLKNIGLYVTLPSAALYMMNKDQDWYKEIPADARDRNWYIPIGDQILQLPKPFEVGIMFGAGLERVLDHALTEQDSPYKGFSKQVYEALTPDAIPTAVKPLLEVITNYNFFTGQNIETMGDKNSNPADRYNAYNSQAAIGTAKLLEQLNPKSPVSPKQIDHLIRGYTGTLGSYVSEGVDSVAGLVNSDMPQRPSRGVQTAPFVRSFFVKNLEGNNRSVNDFYNLFDELRLKKKTAENKGQEFEHVDEKKVVEKLKRAIDDLQKEKKNVLNSSTIGSKDKAEQIKQLNQQITELAKEGNAYNIK